MNISSSHKMDLLGHFVVFLTFKTSNNVFSMVRLPHLLYSTLLYLLHTLSSNLSTLVSFIVLDGCLQPLIHFSFLWQQWISRSLRPSTRAHCAGAGSTPGQACPTTSVATSNASAEAWVPAAQAPAAHHSASSMSSSGMRRSTAACWPCWAAGPPTRAPSYHRSLPAAMASSSRRPAYPSRSSTPGLGLEPQPEPELPEVVVEASPRAVCGPGKRRRSARRRRRRWRRKRRRSGWRTTEV